MNVDNGQALSGPIALARNFFPRGLVQAEGGFRFAMDSLLLGSFVANHEQRPRGKPSRIVDLGTGCGVVALSLLLQQPDWTVTGVDVQPGQIKAAQGNAISLGFADRLSLLHLDLSDPGPPTAPPDERHYPLTLMSLPAGGFDLAVCNPPFPLRGRPPAGQARQRAMVGGPADLASFCRAAAHTLKPRGRFFLVYPASGVPSLFLALAAARFGVRRLLPVHSRPDQAAVLVLLEARLGAAHDLRLEPPLVLYQGSGPQTRLSAEALAFCPFLKVNQGPRGAG